MSPGEVPVAKISCCGDDAWMQTAATLRMQERPGVLCKGCGPQAPLPCLSMQVAMCCELQGLHVAASICTQRCAGMSQLMAPWLA